MKISLPYARKLTLKSGQNIFLWLAAARAIVAIAAIPLAPFLYKKHFLWLVLMRPTKEVLLAGGFFSRVGKVDIWQITLAAIPLSILAVWNFYHLGRAFSREIKEGKLPFLGSKLFPKDKLADMRKILKKRGWKVVFLGRLALFPSTLVAAAAGASKMDRRQFLLADAAGGILSVAEVVGVGFLLGGAFESGKKWVTAAGAVLLVGLLFLLGRYLRKDV